MGSGASTEAKAKVATASNLFAAAGVKDVAAIGDMSPDELDELLADAGAVAGKVDWAPVLGAAREADDRRIEDLGAFIASLPAGDQDRLQASLDNDPATSPKGKGPNSRALKRLTLGTPASPSSPAEPLQSSMAVAVFGEDDNEGAVTALTWARLLKSLRKKRAMKAKAKAKQKITGLQISRSIKEALPELADGEKIRGLERTGHSDLLKKEALRMLASRQIDVVEAMRDLKWQVRWAAVESLVGSIPEIGIPPTRKALDDPVWKVREAAVEALSKLAGAQAIPEITDMLRDPEEKVRIAAVISLGIIGTGEVVPSLDKALYDSSKYVRKEVAESLGKSLSLEALPGLQTLSEDNSWIVRSEAVKELTKIEAMKR